MALHAAPTGGEEPDHVVTLEELCAEGAAVLFETRKVDDPRPSKGGGTYVGVDVVLTVLTGKHAGTIDRTHKIMKAGITDKLPREIGDHVYGRLEFYGNDYSKKQLGLTGPAKGDIELAQAAIDQQRRTPAAAGASVGGGAADDPEPPFAHAFPGSRPREPFVMVV